MNQTTLGKLVKTQGNSVFLRISTTLSTTNPFCYVLPEIGGKFNSVVPRKLARRMTDPRLKGVPHGPAATEGDEDSHFWEWGSLQPAEGFSPTCICVFNRAVRILHKSGYRRETSQIGFHRAVRALNSVNGIAAVLRQSRSTCLRQYRIASLPADAPYENETFEGEPSETSSYRLPSDRIRSR
jgi:hypothetical protein